MADTKLSAVGTELTAPASGDWLYAVDDPSGTPASTYITLGGIGFVRPLGQISVEGNATTTTFAGASSDWSNKAQVTVFDTDGESTFYTTPDNTNDHITIDVAGKCMITCCISFNGGTGDTISFALFKNNGATQLGSRVTRKLGSADVGACSVHTVADLSATDTVELWVQNETDTTAITVQDCVLTVH